MVRYAMVVVMMVVAAALSACGFPVEVVDFEYSKSAMGTTLKSITVRNTSNDKRVRNIWVRVVDNQKGTAVYSRADGSVAVTETTNRVGLSKIPLENIVLEPGDQQAYRLPEPGLTFAAVNPTFEIESFSEEALAK